MKLNFSENMNLWSFRRIQPRCENSAEKALFSIVSNHSGSIKILDMLQNMRNTMIPPYTTV